MRWMSKISMIMTSEINAQELLGAFSSSLFTSKDPSEEQTR